MKLPPCTSSAAVPVRARRRGASPVARRAAVAGLSTLVGWSLAGLVLSIWVLVAAPGRAAAQPAGEPAGGSEDAALGDEEIRPEDLDAAFLEQIRVYQQKPFMRKLRFELAPLGGISVNETVTHYFSAGAVARFHINDQFAVGASYRKYFHADRASIGEVEDGHGVFPERRFRDFYAGGEFTYTPALGKFALFDAIVHFDLYLIGGVGMMRSWERGREGDNLFAWNVGIGSRVALASWITFTVELRDYMYIEPYRGGDTFINDVALQAGFSIFFPFRYSYEHPK